MAGGVAGARGKHTLAEEALVRLERRGADVHDHLRAGVRLRLRRPLRIPDVLADVHADAHAGDLVDGDAIARLEVAVFIEDAVVGQELLAVDVDETAVVDDGGRVVDVLLGVDEADDQRDAGASLDDFVQRIEVVADELRPQEEVFRRIAGNGQLGKLSRSTPRERARSTQLEYLGDVPLRSPTVTLIWARPTRRLGISLSFELSLS